MSQENVEIVRGAVEHFMATGDVTWDILDEDLEVHDHDILDGRDYRGHAGFGLWLDDWGVAWGDWSYDAEEFIDAGDHVVVVIRMKVVGRSSGVYVERQDALVYKFHNGKVTRLDYYNSRQQALEAAGLKG